MGHDAAHRRCHDAAAVRRVFARAHAALVADRSTLDALNVFPVADGDTGTNLAATVGPVAAAAIAATDAELGRAVTTAALRSGRGNSGLIISQWIAGWMEQWDGQHLDPVAAAADAARAARAAVGRPVEGTMLTVADGAAGHDDVDAMRRGAVEALRRTPDLLPVLAERGVIDAGGRGLLHVIEASAVEAGAAPLRELPGTSASGGCAEPLVAAVIGYEVRGRIAVPDAGMGDVVRVQAGLLDRGTDVVVAAEGDEISFHAHGDPGPLLTTVLAFGDLRDLHIEALLEHGPAGGDHDG